MDERHKINLQEAGGNNPPEILDKLKNTVEELFDESVYAGSNYLQGKGNQEIAKATEIKAKAISYIGNLDLERQRLLTERDKIMREDKQKMYELKTQRLQEVVNSLLRLKELGANIDINIIANTLIKSINE